MDVKFINPFLNGTLDVLKKMAFMEPRASRPYLKETSVAGGDVSGIIGITGDAIGSLAISFSEPCICDICSRMLGEPHIKADQDVFDAVGEITNMISGVARTHMEKEGMQVYAAIPSIVYGRNHTINHILNSPSIVIPFSTDRGSFVVDVCIKRTTTETRRPESYQVVNVKTAVPHQDAEPPPVRQTPRAAEPVAAAVETDKKAVLQQKLKDMMAVRNDMIRQLAEQPFMEISKRQAFKKKIPSFDNQIKRLKLDLAAVEALSKMTREDLENPKIVKHYQHYTEKKDES